ncbi:MAG TPA: hypothetical protein VFX85_03950 [Solirubrobacterales bacterium]|nr:hypothetical protein [Solirubrobacterales bacterium]
MGMGEGESALSVFGMVSVPAIKRVELDFGASGIRTMRRNACVR